MSVDSKVISDIWWHMVSTLHYLMLWCCREVVEHRPGRIRDARSKRDRDRRKDRHFALLRARRLASVRNETRQGECVVFHFHARAIGSRVRPVITVLVYLSRWVRVLNFHARTIHSCVRPDVTGHKTPEIAFVRNETCQGECVSITFMHVQYLPEFAVL